MHSKERRWEADRLRLIADRRVREQWALLCDPQAIEAETWKDRSRHLRWYLAICGKDGGHWGLRRA